MNLLGNPIFSIIGWIIAFVLVFLEIPLLARCCPSNPTFDNFIKFFERNVTRVFLYAAFAVLEWLSLLIRADTLILCAITLSATFFFYLVAMFKRGEWKSPFLSLFYAFRSHPLFIRNTNQEQPHWWHGHARRISQGDFLEKFYCLLCLQTLFIPWGASPLKIIQHLLIGANTFYHIFAIPF
ncbi:hypothetical protein SmJEL517_g01764 [Synchytrium microbalum]|uniref:Uncharacterized protein n=1 Tax=Synchytrium microbalum TaxID=1806994 RepID=A0A507CEC9_9FUNG|nr:uncharacterized protein SmJEL517_g01764 [Synchytrium microbalum]TPX35935.1 hypothetical protein SmJEL517_g01764 [Synchytrium microbalum]